jgi:DNA topoisomerase I
LYLIYLREKEIQAFVPVEYWTVHGLFDDAKNTVATLTHLAEDDKSPESEQVFSLKQFDGHKIKEKIEDASLIQKIEAELVKNTQYTVASIDSREQKNSPRPPFTTSTLQQAASSRLGFSPKQTMSVAQKLYEGVVLDGQATGLITYMRTDSLNLSADSVSAARQYVERQYPQFLPTKPNYYKGKAKNAQEAHEAIRPTDPLRTPESIRGKIDAAQFRLYDLIWRQTIASQMTPEIRTITTFDLKNTLDTMFSGSMSVQKSAGFRAIQPVKQNEKSYNLTVGDTLFLQNIFQKHDFSQPPARYSAASLIKTLEQLGIGRPSTYASIISTLQDRTYVDAAEKSMVPSALGMKIGELLGEHFPQVTSSELTAQMEDNLDAISHDTKKYAEVLAAFWHPFKSQVELKKRELGANRQQYKTIGTETLQDPAGKGGEMALKLGRFGEYWQSVSDPSIMYPKNFREIAATLAENQTKYGEKVAGLISPVSGDPLVVRVSKASLNAYIATEKYVVGSKEKALSIATLDEKGWTQAVVDELYAKTTPSGSGKKKWGSKRRFTKKK